MLKIIVSSRFEFMSLTLNVRISPELPIQKVNQLISSPDPSP